MGILLSEQLKQTKQLKAKLNEVSYHAPIFGVHYYEQGQHSIGQKAGRRMFYDFYAMEFLWSFLGSGQIPKAEREKLMQLPDDDPRKEVISSKFHRFLPSASVKTIDNLYEQVINAVSKNLINYIRAAVIQEFQYLVSSSPGWRVFRKALVSEYNFQKSISKEKFQFIVRSHIPDMEPYPDVIMRLLKFSKYFSKINTSDHKDVYDVVRKNKDVSEVPGELDFMGASEEPSQKSTEEPDETDYDVSPAKREFGKYGPENPSPYEHPWSGMSAFKDVDELPKISSDDDDDESQEKEPLKEEYINIKKIKNVYDAMKKSGVTLDDIEKSYNKIPWGGAFGGPKWGEGAISLLKLINFKKNLTPEDMNHIIDHIYDLQHNTGSLLNKGPMFISEKDLNRRYKITDITRFLPYVSPVIKNIILRYQKYLKSDPESAELDVNLDAILDSPKLPLEPEISEKLKKMGFAEVGDGSLKVNIHAKNKQGQHVSSFYILSKHNVGKLGEKGNFVKTDGAAPIYVSADNYKADIKPFKNADEVVNYFESIKNQFSFTPSQSFSSPNVKAAQVDYLNSHTKTKLPPSQEQDLLDINIGWRHSSKRYKAYFPDGHRFLFYVFTDGTFLLTHSNSDQFKTATDWPSAYLKAKAAVQNAQPYPEKEKAQAEINQLKGKKTIKPSGMPSKKFVFPSGYIPQLNAILSVMSQGSGVVYKTTTNEDGILMVYSEEMGNLFAIGLELGLGFSNPYKIIHYLEVPHGLESWSFITIASAMKFIENNISGLVNFGLNHPAPLTKQLLASITPTAFSTSGKELPDNSPTPAAYAVHKGLDFPPKNSIRLTKTDEEKIKEHGFSPKMIGNDIWYIQNPTGDTVKFFPDDSAKVIFTSQSPSMKAPVANFASISKALSWLESKYTEGILYSPIAMGPGNQLKSPEKGIKAGIMFEKTIENAGFKWNDIKGLYFDDNPVPGTFNFNTLKIFPNRSSTLNFSDGTVKHFPNLASLVAYLKEGYQVQKSSVTAPGQKPPEQNWGKWSKIQGIKKLIMDMGFKNHGTLIDNSHLYKDKDENRVYLYPNGISKYFNYSDGKLTVFNNQDDLIAHLLEMAKKLPNFPLNNPPDDLSQVPIALSSHDLSVDERNIVKNVITEWNLTPEISGAGVIINKNGKHFLSIVKHNNVYQFNKYAEIKNDPKYVGTWESISNGNNFRSIVKDLEIYLKNQVTSKSTNMWPSGREYKTEDNEANADLIKLNTQDEFLLNSIGFKWTPNENHYYKNAEGSTINFTNTGKANYFDITTSEGMKEFGSIPEALIYLVNEHKLKEIGFTPKSKFEFPDWYGTEVKQTYFNPQTHDIIQLLNNGIISYFKWNGHKMEPGKEYKNIDEFIKIYKEYHGSYPKFVPKKDVQKESIYKSMMQIICS